MTDLKKKGRPKKDVEEPIVPSTKKVKKLTFDQWAARKGLPQHHRGGMRASLKNPFSTRTELEWDLFFVNY